MFNELEKINYRPEPFKFYTAKELWTDEHTSKKMLEFHLHESIDVSSRNIDFINRSVDWISSQFDLNKSKSVYDFGCGQGIVEIRSSVMCIRRYMSAMNTILPEDSLPDERSNYISEFLYYAGCRYWTASILPALVGTTLPFWLRPLGFSFKWIAAIEFLIAAVFFHAGFSFLLAWVQNKITPSWPKIRLIKYACIFVIIAGFLGLHLNNNLILQLSVPKYIFIVYGLASIFAGVLYVLPPFSFYQRVGGEIVIAEGLGMIPLLGAYLIQVGDLTRRVYLTSLPLVVATGLWVWIDELASRKDDENIGRKTMVIEFGSRFSGRYGVGALSFLLISTILLSVFSGSVNSMALISLLLAGLVWKVVTVSWNEYSSPERMAEMRKFTFILHFAIGSILIGSSLVTILIDKW